MRIVFASCWLALLGCGDNGSSPMPDGPASQVDAHADAPVDAAGSNSVTATVRMVNGASPNAAPHRRGRLGPAAPPADGNWQITPNHLHAPITGIVFSPAAGSNCGPPQMIPLDNCALDFDIATPGLAPSMSCSFTLPACTYGSGALVYGATFDILIDDPVNGFYTDPSSAAKITTTAPAGGAQAVTLPNPRANAEAAITLFTPPLVVAPGADAGPDAGVDVTVSALFDALQFFQVNVNGGVATLGADGNGRPGFPDSVVAVGAPAAIGYYVAPSIGTPYSYVPTSSSQLSIGVLYSNAGQPAFLGMGINGQLSGCGPIGPRFLFPGRGNGYLGLDSNQVLGWASFSDAQATTYSVELAMPEVSTLGQATTLKCVDITSDPMPSGDSFSLGAPMIANPTFQTTMTLVAN